MPDLKVAFLGTGAGGSIHRAHTAIVFDLPNGVRLLLDASSGNSAMRSASQLGIAARDFNHVLLSHHHDDHMMGLQPIQYVRTRSDPEGPPLEIHCSERTLESVKRLFQISSPSSGITQDGLHNAQGIHTAAWRPADPGERVELGDGAYASCFSVDHVDGALGWRVDSDGLAVVFSGDTRSSPNLVEAAQGARLLIHEAYCTDEDRAEADAVGHSTAADAGRAAALAGVEELVITHIANSFNFDTQPLLKEARQHFDGPITVAEDLYQMTVAAG